MKYTGKAYQNWLNSHFLSKLLPQISRYCGSGRFNKRGVVACTAGNIWQSDLRIKGFVHVFRTSSPDPVNLLSLSKCYVLSLHSCSLMYPLQISSTAWVSCADYSTAARASLPSLWTPVDPTPPSLSCASVCRNLSPHKFDMVTFCDRHKCHQWSHIECDKYKTCFYFCLESGSERCIGGQP